MPSQILYPGTATALYNPSLLTIAGSGAQLADGDDATYVATSIVSGNRGVTQAPVDAFTGDPAKVTAITLHARIASAYSDAADVRFVVGAGSSGTSWLAAAIGGNFPLIADNVPHYYDHVFSGFDFGTDLATAAAGFAAGNVYAWLTAQNGDLRYYEVSVELTYSASAPAPLRLYPRSSTRLYPRRRTRRPGTF